MQTVLSISNLEIGYSEPLITDFSTVLNDGGLVVFSGANGAGKSTLLKTIAGILPCKNNRILIDNKCINQYTFEERAQKIALVNNARISETFVSIRQMVELGAYSIFDKKEKQKLIDEALKTMGIEHLQEKNIHEISDGEWQKANVARALAQNTPIILMDEPSAFLDYPSKVNLFETIQTLSKISKKIIIVSTHDIEIAQKFGSLFWHLNNKKIAISECFVGWDI